MAGLTCANIYSSVIIFLRSWLTNAMCMDAIQTRRARKKATVFRIPKKCQEREKWIEFLNRKDIDVKSSDLFVCELHFEKKIFERKQ